MTITRYAVKFNAKSGSRMLEDTRFYSRKSALSQAAHYDDSEDARIVKITTRPKGWQPVSTPPPESKMVLTIINSAIRIECREGGVWKDGTGGKVFIAPTHWRHLPKPPKGGQ